MLRPFTPVPRWLDISLETSERHVYTKTPSYTRYLPELELALEFQLLCFESLYRLGLTDRQAAEVTALVILLHKRYGHVTLVPITEEGVEKWKRENPGKIGPRWFREGSRFFWAFDTLDEFFQAWMELHLPKSCKHSGVGQRFWAGLDDWPLIFVGGDRVELDKVTERLRILFAQHCLRVPVTGWWDTTTLLACKRFQMTYPKVMMPWKTGVLDGFTYKALARMWKNQKGF
jgi:hypothetical protein